MVLNIEKGDIIDIIFPATSCSKSEIDKIKNYVKNKLKLEPRIEFENELILNPENLINEFPQNHANFRFLQFKKALENEDSKIMWCARGGYCSGDILPFLEKMQPIKQNKIFIGFSDISSLTTFLQDNWGWKTICAPVLLQLARGEIVESAENELHELIFGEKTKFTYDLEPLNEVVKSSIDLQIFSKLCGGCISVLAGHFGTNYQIDFEEKILFLEDEGEDGERLDRYFRQIIETILTHQKLPSAILLGNFLQANPHGTPKADNIEIAIKRFCDKISHFGFKIPVFQVKDKNLGHSNKMRPLILGHNGKISEINNEYTLIIDKINI